MPSAWHIAWIADSSGISFVAMDSLGHCDLDTARVSVIDPLVTPADSAAHLTTLRLCSQPGPPARRASFMIDQPGGSQGRLKVVAIDPADPAQESVIESNEITYNGGVLGDFAPALLRATSTHVTAQLEVDVVGWGLDSVTTMQVGAADDLWRVPLTISHRDSTNVAGSAQVEAELPASVVQVATSQGTKAVTGLPAESIGAAAMSAASIDTIFYRDPNPSVYPKDFAFYYNAVFDPIDPVKPWKGVFHLFYIRNKRGLQAPDSIIAHAWTDSLGKPWSVDTLAFRPSAVGWDAKRVWAPSIQQVGNLFYMFYTGVDAQGNQSIGYATTPNLGRTNIAWTRVTSPVHTPFNTTWADRTGQHVPNVRQFRDPFVMPDPVFTGFFLLFNVGEEANVSTTANPAYVVGVARNKPGTLNLWDDIGSYTATDQIRLPVTGAVESPMIVRDSLTGAWRMFVANADYDDNGFFSTIILTQNPGDSLTNRTAAAWPRRDSLYAYLGNDVDVIAWQACEHLQIGRVHFFAGYQGDGIGITQMHWNPVTQRFTIAYPSIAGADSPTRPISALFRISELRPHSGVIRFTLESGDAIVPDLAIYDVSGRRVRKLSSGRGSQGHASYTWDCRDESGQISASGVYFARLTGAHRGSVLRVPIIR